MSGMAIVVTRPGHHKKNLPTPLAITHDHIHYFTVVYRNPELRTDSTTS